MAKKMLIDARHFEEMRMAITDGTRLENLEIESFNKKQLKGSIYLAKVVRIEPSLQAAFVEFGGNRQGFLSFSEIHPDYYQIPVADRALLEKEIQKESGKRDDALFLSHGEDDLTDQFQESQEDALTDASTDTSLEMKDGGEGVDDDAGEEDGPRRFHLRHHYKLQEVIKRGQIMLVQVVREERGGKGAALTTYLSLPGRYCVLMPNSGERRGGISRKISDASTRSRLRKILDSFDLLEGISLIVRTAGADKNKTELKKDFEYLLRLWADIREKTLQSIAPTIIYAEGDLIKRALRDTYTKDIEQIIIDGDEAYKSAKAFMKTVSPSHAKKVSQHKDKNISLFQAHHVDELIDDILSPCVALPSGGSLVIAQTEALVAIDVNSGKSTRERHIDETAIKTNLEAAREIGRQLRLRDLAGIIVIDFIDMRDSKHNAQVERALKESVSTDRARIQIGRISQFGLLEMSRQRLRSSILESNTHACPHCHGAGVVRSVESMGLFLLRKMEAVAIEYANKSLETLLTMSVFQGVDSYLLNQKRHEIVFLESKYNIKISVQVDHHMKHVGYHFTVKDTKTHDIVFMDDGRSLLPSKHSPAEHAHRVPLEEGEGVAQRHPKENDSSLSRRKNQRGADKRNPVKNTSPQKKNEGIISAEEKEKSTEIGEEKSTENPLKKSRRRRRKNRKGDRTDHPSSLNQAIIEDLTITVSNNEEKVVGDILEEVENSGTVMLTEDTPKRTRQRRYRRTRPSNRSETDTANTSSVVISSDTQGASTPSKTYEKETEKNPPLPANTQGKKGESEPGLEKNTSKKKRKGLWERLFDS